MKRHTLLTILILLLAAPRALVADEEGDPITSVPETTVTDTRTRRAIESLTTSADVVGHDELDLKDGRALDEALTEYAGVDVVGQSRYGQEVRINLRGVTSGFGTQRALVLLDGRPLTDEYLSNADITQYPLAAASRVEMVRGPASAAYGSNALGGVINFIPGRGSSPPATSVYGEYGSFNSSRFGVRHGSMLGENTDIFFSLNVSNTDGYLDNSAGDDMDWEAGTGFLNLGYEDERGGARAYLYGFKGHGTDESFDRDIRRNMQDVILFYRFFDDEEAVTKIHAYHSGLDQTLEWFFGFDSDYDQDTWGTILTQTFRVGDHHLLGGIAWRREEATVVDFAGTVDESEDNWSFFLQDEWQVLDDLRLVGGLRYDKRDNIDGELSWRIGANWKVGETTVLRAAAGKAFRAPSISDRYLPTTQFFGVTFEGNPLLDPEYLYSVEAGVDQRIVDGVTVIATGFYSQFKDFWDFVMQDDGIFRPENIGEVRIYGLEVGLRGELGAGFAAMVAYTYTNATYEKWEGRDDVIGNRLDDNVRNRGTATVEWVHKNGHAARASLLVSGDRYTDPENTSEGKLDPFLVLDLQGRAVLADWATLTLNIQNVFNNLYYTRAEFRAPPRAIFVGLNLTF